MKSIITLSALVLATCCIALTSCTGVFTKDDAKEIGQVIVKDSLAIGTQIISGAQVDPKVAATQLGLKVANMALARATANMMKAGGPSEAPVSSETIAAEADRIIKGALEHAQGQIPGITSSQQETVVAQLVAAGISEKAIEVINPPDGGN